MKEKYNKYLIESIVFDNEPIKILKQNQISLEYYDELIKQLGIFITNNNKMSSFDDYLLNNTYDVITYLRENYPYKDFESKSRIYDYYNYFIQTLNVAEKYNSTWFYLQQSLERGIYIDYNLKMEDEYVPSMAKEDIKASICCDNTFYNILTKNENYVSNSEYKMLVMNPFFLYSVSFFLCECPDILEKNSILKKVLIENNKVIHSLKYIADSEREKFKSLEKNSKVLLKDIRW